MAEKNDDLEQLESDVARLGEQIDERRGHQAELTREAAALRERRVHVSGEIDDLEVQRTDKRKALTALRRQRGLDGATGEPVVVDAAPAKMKAKGR